VAARRRAVGSKTLPAEIRTKALAAVARSPMPLLRDVQIPSGNLIELSTYYSGGSHEVTSH